MQEPDIHDEIAAFLAAQASLSENKDDPWVVFASAAFQARFASFEAAYEYAVENFPVGKFLIRNLFASEPFIPMMYVAE